MVLKAYLYNENIFHIDLLQIMAIFVVKHFLSCYKDTISCMVKKKNFPSGIFNVPVFLNLAEVDLGLDKGIPSLF